MASHGCPQKEIAYYLGVDYKTLLSREWFKETFEAGKSDYKYTLRQRMYDRLMDPKCPPALLIFMAKNELGMSDNPNGPAEDAADFGKRILAYVREGQRRSGVGGGDDSGGDAD